MLSLIYRSTIATFYLAVLLCGVYPLVVASIGKVFFPDASSGSLIYSEDGKLVGSKLIGQAFSKPEYFHTRPSAAGPNQGYDAAHSMASNLGPTNPKLLEQVKANAERILKENPTLKFGQIPVDMVTTSGSGLDPHISPDAAYAQIQRVADARSMSSYQLKTLVQKHIEAPQLGFLGEPVVNVLMLNLDLDDVSQARSLTSN